MKWRHWKREFAKVTQTEGPSPHIAAWFFKRYDDGKVAEIRVYQKRLLHKKETTIKQIETTKKFKETHLVENHGDHAHDHVISKHEIDKKDSIAKKET